MKKKKISASRRRDGVLPIDTYSLMGDPAALSYIDGLTLLRPFMQDYIS